jgi:hypothetical protein
MNIWLEHSWNTTVCKMSNDSNNVGKWLLFLIRDFHYVMIGVNKPVLLYTVMQNAYLCLPYTICGTGSGPFSESEGQCHCIKRAVLFASDLQGRSVVTSGDAYVGQQGRIQDFWNGRGATSKKGHTRRERNPASERQGARYSGAVGACLPRKIWKFKC